MPPSLRHSGRRGRVSTWSAEGGLKPGGDSNLPIAQITQQPPGLDQTRWTCDVFRQATERRAFSSQAESLQGGSVALSFLPAICHHYYY